MLRAVGFPCCFLSKCRVCKDCRSGLSVCCISRWASLEEEPEEEAPKKKKRRRDGPEPAAPAVAPDTNGKVARKQGGTSLLRKVRGRACPD